MSSKRKPRVGIICPSQRPSPVGLAAGLRVLADHDYEPVFGPLLKSHPPRHLFSHGSPAERANEVGLMLADKDVDAVLVASGGLGAAEILPFIAWDALARELGKRKSLPVVMGSSDASSLLWGLYIRLGVPCVYGACLADAYELASGGIPRTPLGDCLSELWKPHREYLLRGVCMEEGSVKGWLAPFCLSAFRQAVGTDWCRWKTWQGEDRLILLVDDGGLSVSGQAEKLLYEGLTQLGLAGLLSAAAVVFGDLESGGPYGEPTPSMLDVIRHTQRLYGFTPCWAGVQFGHTSGYALPIPFGARGELTCAHPDQGTLRIDWTTTPWAGRFGA